MKALESIKTNFKKHVKWLCISLYSPAVKKFLRNNPKITLIGVSGSVGKTSTKFAVAESLKASGKEVLIHEGAYNDPLSSIFVLMEQPYPNINSLLALIRAYFSLQKAKKREAQFDFAVLELGTDMPGEMRQFAKYLELDICVICAITPEHMVNFSNVEEVSNEELEVLKYSKKIIACKDLIPKKYQHQIEKSGLGFEWYGTAKGNHVSVSSGGLVDVGLKTKREISLRLGGGEVRVRSGLLHLHSGFVMGAAVCVANSLGLDLGGIARALETVGPAPGRGRLLAGRRGSIIIDDSYNNVGANVSIASLDLLYEFNTRRRIAILGGINETGERLEREAHTEVALHLNKKKLEEVILIGRLAKTYYKPILETSDIKYKYFSTPYKAGDYLQHKLVAGMVVLVKGSQNGIYSEEAIKPLLQDINDEKLLVRQSATWIAKKLKSFGLEA